MLLEIEIGPRDAREAVEPEAGDGPERHGYHGAPVVDVLQVLGVHAREELERHLKLQFRCAASARMDSQHE